jgi:hypothetical protein
MIRNRPACKSQSRAPADPSGEGDRHRNLPRRSTCDGNHAFVNRFILMTNFSPALAEVDCDNVSTASGSGSKLVRIPQPPSPPGLRGSDPGRLTDYEPDTARLSANDPLIRNCERAHIGAREQIQYSSLRIGRWWERVVADSLWRARGHNSPGQSVSSTSFLLYPGQMRMAKDEPRQSLVEKRLNMTRG